jgi:hypothetical protein
MNGTRDTSQARTTGNGDELDPRAAATLLERTRRQARRQLEPSPPWLLVIRAVLVLAACGAVWLSVRGQHPYRGPTIAAVLAVVAFGIVNLGVTIAVSRRATTGVRGRSRLRRGEVTVLTVAWVAPYVVMAVLAAGGVSDAVVYGWYPVSVPLIVAGLAWAGMMAARGHWRAVGTAVATTVVGAVGVYAGPVGAWAVAGVGLCVTLLGTAATIAWQQRR